MHSFKLIECLADGLVLAGFYLLFTHSNLIKTLMFAIWLSCLARVLKISLVRDRFHAHGIFLQILPVIKVMPDLVPGLILAVLFNKFVNII